MDLTDLRDAEDQGPSIFNSLSAGFDEWLEVNAPILAETDLPTFLIPRLHHKVSNSVYDLGSFVGLARDEDEPVGCQLSAVALQDIEREGDVFLVDHCWTFADPVEARIQLKAIPALRERIEGLLEMEPLSDPTDGEVRARLDEMTARLWTITGSYEDEAGNKAYFILDELGSRLVPPVDSSVTSAFTQTVLVDASSGEAYSIIWAQRDVSEGETVTCGKLPNGRMRLNRLRSALWAFEVEDPNSADSDDEEERAGKTATLQPHPEHGKVHPTLIPVPPSPAPSSEIHLRAYHISALRARLTSVGYTAPALAELFRAPRGYGLPAESLSNPATRMDTDTKILALDTPSNSNLVTLTRFFLIGTSLARSVLEPALTPELLAFCEDQNMVFARDDATKDPILHPLVQLNPVTLPSASTTLFIVTDFSHSSAASVGGAFDPVMHLGMDSLALVGSLSRLTSDLHLLADRAASENRPLRALDLCTGSGIQGLTAAALLREQQIQGGAGVETTLVDTNPRAGRLAAFNSSLNGLHVAVHIGDGYTPLPVGVKYDLILANPPYIPTGGSAVRLEAYGDGGAKGDDVMAAVFRGLQSRLVDGGMVCVVGNIVNPEQFAENVTSWVGNDVGLNGTLKYGRVWTVDEYSALIVGKEDPDYANALRQSGVQGVANGLFVGKKVAQRDVSVVRGTDELWHEMNLVEGEKA